MHKEEIKLRKYISGLVLSAAFIGLALGNTIYAKENRQDEDNYIQEQDMSLIQDGEVLIRIVCTGTEGSDVTLQPGTETNSGAVNQPSSSSTARTIGSTFASAKSTGKVSMAAISNASSNTFADSSVGGSGTPFTVIQAKDLPVGAVVASDIEDYEQTITGEATLTWSNLPAVDEYGHTIYYYVVEKQATANADEMSVRYAYTYNTADTPASGISTVTITNSATRQTGDLTIDKTVLYNGAADTAVSGRTFRFKLYEDASATTIAKDANGNDVPTQELTVDGNGRATATIENLHLGTYFLYEPLRLRPEDSGLTIEGPATTPDDFSSGSASGHAVISGGLRLTGWKRQGKLLVADIPDFNGRPIDFRQLWVNGRKAVRARDVSDFEQMHRILTYDKKNQVLWVPRKAVDKIVNSKSSDSKYLEMVLHEMWCTSNLRIKGMKVQGDSVALTFHNPEGPIQFQHPWPSPMTPDTKHPSPFYLTGAKELLDQPGEWYHDFRDHKLYYWPREGEARQTGGQWEVPDAVVPVLETLVEFVGTPERPVRNVTVKGVTFSHTTWMRPSEKGHVPLQAGMFLTEAYKLRPQIDRPNNHKLDNQGWLGRADAAVELRCADGVDFRNCRFEHLGGSGLDYVEGCHGGTTSHCVFTDIAMNGYVCGSFSPEGLETHLPYQPTDFREVCTAQVVEESEFSDVTNEDWGCVAGCAGYVSGITIAHNTIHDVSYTGISLGWGWNRDLVCMKDNKVHANLIYNYAQHMYDCAGIYTLGNQPGTVISENVVRDIATPSYVHDPNHWFYLYTDEGSSNITLRDNWTPAEKFLKNANGPGNVWQNNGPQVSEAIRQAAGKRVTP